MNKILYIEDHADTADAVKIILESAGFNAEIATTGEEGIQKAKKGFDLILIDIMLPGMSGWDVLQELKKNKIKTAKYIFLSAVPVSKERREELKKAGVSDYITKPFEREDLIARVNETLGKTAEVEATPMESEEAALPESEKASTAEGAELPPAESEPKTEPRGKAN